jgi:tRNA(adenine34) deaminase
MLEATPSDEVMMDQALSLANEAALAGEIPVGAVVFHGTTIVGKGGNRREVDDDPTAHAEIVALREAGRTLGRWRLDDCTLVVTLEPCPMCAGALVNARIGRLVFGITDPKAGAAGTLYDIPTDVRLNHRMPVTGGVRAETCLDVLQQFFRRRREAGRA